jgi:hypothetical protein
VAIDASNPYMGQYDAFALQAKTAYQKALAKIGTQRTGFQTGYGLGPDGKPLANAPYGQYQQMMGGMAQQAEQSDAMQHARGLGGGISRQAAEAVQRGNRQTTYDFGQNYQAGLTAFSDAEQGAGSTYENSLFEKMQDITQQAIQDRMFNPGAGAEMPEYGNPLTPELPGAGTLPWKPPVRNVKPKRKRRRRRR